jgi:hypothetical protein
MIFGESVCPPDAFPAYFARLTERCWVDHPFTWLRFARSDDQVGTQLRGSGTFPQHLSHKTAVRFLVRARATHWLWASWYFAPTDVPDQLASET